MLAAVHFQPLAGAVLLALALALAVASGAPVVASPLFIPASAGSMRETQFDRFRKGFSTVDSDRADQFDSSANLATYDRASTTGAATQAAEIGAGISPFGAGAASTGAQSKSLTSEFDRGAMTTANARQVNQAGRRTSTALDQGLVRNGAASYALIGGPVAGAGSSFQTLLQSRHQAAADADHIDQHLAEDDLVSEQYDRGIVRRDASSAAAIGEQFGAPYGAAVASEGQQTANFDESRQRGLNAAKRSLVADRSANLLNEGYHKQLKANAGANDVVLVGPAGSSAGRIANAQHLESSQGALQHADSVENRIVNNAQTKALDNTWASGSQKQQVAIGSAGLAGEVSSGQAASRLANGYDRVAETGIANSAAKKTASSTRKTFDDRELDQALKSNALIGGCL